MSDLEVREISKTLGSVQALKPLSFHVKAGQIVGFLGQNGAGKTTAMRVILGLLEPDGGDVFVSGFRAKAVPQEARVRLGGLIEHPGFHPHWSGVRNLYSMARLRGMSRVEAKADSRRLLALLNLSHAENRAVRTWSQGMRQRLGLALALMGKPRFLILDEPMNGLDPEGIADFRRLLLKLRDEEQVGILISSHQLAELAPICDRVIIIRQGTLLVDAPTSELLAGRSRIVIEVEPKDGTADTLRELGFAQNGNRYESPAEGKDSADLAETLFRKGVRIRTLTHVQPSLEDIYLEASHNAEAHVVIQKSAPTSGKADASRIAPPRALWRCLRYDLTRITKGQVLLSCLVPSAFGWNAALGRAASDRAAMTSLGSGQLASTTAVTAFEILGRAIEAGLPILLFFAAGIASQSVASEASYGTLRNVLLRPLSRTHLGLAKILGALSLTAVAAIALVVFSLAIAAWTYDFEAVYEVLPNGERYEFLTQADLWKHVPKLFLEPILPLFALTLLGLLVGSLLRRPAAALGGTMLLLLAAEGLRPFFRMKSYEGFLPTAHLPSPLGDVTSYVRYYGDAVQGVGNAFWPLQDVGAWPMILWTVVLSGLAILSIIKKPVP
ncbi:MAG TPA: ATP-binding cassette domain-containing protein [Planctomycetota bacterium]|nr:ATP-binding cassette domain-containing protein [Planctomycetota bacterium]